MTDVAPEPFSAWLRRMLSERGWTVEEAHDRSGVKAATLWKWLSGAEPKLSGLVAIVYALGELPPELDPRRADDDARVRRLRAEMPGQKNSHRAPTERDAGDLDNESATSE